MREVVGFSVEKDTSMHVHAHDFHPSYLYILSLCFFCVLGKLLTGCQVQPGLQKLCGHLFLPVWHAHTRIYTRTHV